MASTIKVNTITTQSGSTLTIGESGKTISLASGATATGFGRTGAVDWQTTKKTGDFTAATTEGYFVDTSSGAITATLPSSPSAGAIVGFKDYTGTFGTNALTIARNGSNIQGNANDSKISTNRASVIMVYIDSTEGWVFTVESNVADLQDKEYVTASGGTETTSGDFKIHTFTGDGTFTVSAAGNSAGSNTVDYLVIAGGGGGAGDWSGGGGAGGYRESFPNPATGGLSVSAQAYPIQVGSGGAAGSTPSRASSGEPSIFSSITSAGGGGGGADAGANPDSNGGDGGSGGGGSLDGNGGAGNTPPVSPVQGYPGANGNRSNGLQGGGGGGASETGQTQAGGDGRASSINGSPVTRGGGGGGARNGSTGAGGAGGGGTGSNAGSGGSAGTANTGGGGGAMNPPSNGFAGGSGVVIIRYKYQN